MNILIGLLEIGLGVAILGFGLFLFYSFRPLFYALYGSALGLWLANVITGNDSGHTNLLGWILAIAGAVVFAFLPPYLSPFLRIFLGAQMGATLAFAVANVFNWWTWLAVVLACLGAVVFAFALPLAFDLLIVMASVIVGASLVMSGVFDATGLEWFNRATSGIMTTAIWVALLFGGYTWQNRNIGKWVKKQVREQILAGS